MFPGGGAEWRRGGGAEGWVSACRASVRTVRATELRGEQHKHTGAWGSVGSVTASATSFQEPASEQVEPPTSAFLFSQAIPSSRLNQAAVTQQEEMKKL